MIIFLYGTDGYRLAQNRETVINSYRAKHASGMNLMAIDGADRHAPDMLADALKSQSFFDEVKLVVINNIFAAANTSVFADLLVRYDAAIDKKCVVLATHNGPLTTAKPKELAALLSDKKNLVRHFEPLAGAQLAAWIKKEALARGASFEPTALRQFIALCGADSWQAINNLDKLANYSRGPITEAAIAKLITVETEPNIFEFIDALGARDVRKGTDLLYREIMHGRDPYYILTMMVYQFRNMLVVKDLLNHNLNSAAVAKESGLHPFVIRKMTSATKAFTIEELRHRYGELLQLELNAKNGIEDLGDGLFTLVLAGAR